MSAELGVPQFEELVADLNVLREHGLVRLRRLQLPALHRAAVVCDLVEGEGYQPAAVESLVRQAVARFGGGQLGDAAEYTLCLAQGTRDWPVQDRRRKGAEIYEVSPDRFRKAQERTIIEQTAEEILNLCYEQRLRQSNGRMRRHEPADSRLAVQWVERFEAYYRIWTPVSQLSADLRAAVDTRREPNLGHAPWDESFTDYDPEDQARGYARSAFYGYVSFHLELKRFKVKHGGLWLLSNQVIESNVADAVYRIGWHNPLNDDDDAWLRRELAHAQDGAQDQFSHVVLAHPTGKALHDEWQEFVAACDCPGNASPNAHCQVHLTIKACEDYLKWIDEDWDRIADWYRPGQKRPKSVDGQSLYDQLLRDRQESQEVRPQSHQAP